MTTDHGKVEKFKILEDCLLQISQGDAVSGLNLAEMYLGELPSDDTRLPLIVMEALILQSSQLGSDEAKDFLENKWRL